MTDEALPWQDTTLDPRDRARRLVAAMSFEQKVAQLHGAMTTINIYDLMPTNGDAESLSELADQFHVERHVEGIDELGIPRFRITNGPVGIGMGDGAKSPKATALPMTIGLAASFDPVLAHEYGDVIGSEAATLGQHVLEGPAVCLQRTPIAGRNFEYFSEDPYLTGVLGTEVTRAIQDHGIIAVGKHFALNDQETERFRASVEIEESVLRELYLLPFEMLVKDADIAAIMSSYNRVRGVYATENHPLLTTILREEWGFEGYVQSDFWSTRSAAPSLNAGLDHEMPDDKWLNEDNLSAALQDTSLEAETIDRALIRRFTQMFRMGIFDRDYRPGEIDAGTHGAIARRIGAEAAVLLKNDADLLPLDPEVASIVVIGQADYVEHACQGGGGSSRVDPLYTVDPITGLTDVLSSLGAEAQIATVTVADDLSDLDEATTAAAAADTVIIMAGLVATEGADRDRPVLPNNQDRMISALLDENPNSVVVLKDSSPVLMPWIGSASAVMEVWNPGAEDGHIVADLLFGRVTPSGKLPITYPRSDGETIYADHPERHPGLDEGAGYPVIRYSEGLEMGYRWYQANAVSPLFSFGHGLSYTSFHLGEVRLDAPKGIAGAVTVRGRITNTGQRSGAEVVQVYLGLDEPGQPPKRLVGFDKITLEPAAGAEFAIVIDGQASHHPFSVWDQGHGGFRPADGDVTVFVGTSAADTPHVLTISGS